MAGLSVLLDPQRTASFGYLDECLQGLVIRIVQAVLYKSVADPVRSATTYYGLSPGRMIADSGTLQDIY